MTYRREAGTLQGKGKTKMLQFPGSVFCMQLQTSSSSPYVLWTVVNCDETLRSQLARPNCLSKVFCAAYTVESILLGVMRNKSLWKEPFELSSLGKLQGDFVQAVRYVTQVLLLRSKACMKPGTFSGFQITVMSNLIREEASRCVEQSCGWRIREQLCRDLVEIRKVSFRKIGSEW